MIDGITKDVSDIDLTTIISKGSNPKEWWIDTSATRHVCSDKKMLSTFEQLRLEKRCSWGTLPYRISKGKARWS